MTKLYLLEETENPYWVVNTSYGDNIEVIYFITE